MMRRQIVFSAIVCILGLVASVMLTGCSGVSNDDTCLARVERAEAMFADGDVDNARDMLAKLMADSVKVDTSLCAARAYVRASLLLSKMSEVSAEHADEDIAMAARCFNKAYALSPDSAVAVALSMSFDDQVRLDMLRALTGLMEQRAADSDFPEDSVSVDDELYVCGEGSELIIDEANLQDDEF